MNAFLYLLPVAVQVNLFTGANGLVNCKSNIFYIVIFAQLLRHFMILGNVELKRVLQLQIYKS